MVRSLTIPFAIHPPDACQVLNGEGGSILRSAVHDVVRSCIEDLVSPVICPVPVFASELPPYPYIIPLERAHYLSGRLPNLDDLGHVNLYDHLSVPERNVLLVPVN